MASRHQDPFEGLRLDERFVRGARFLEPSAAERGQVVPAPRGLPGFLHRLVSPPRLPGRSRRIARMVTFLAIVVGMITITVVALRQTATRGGVGTSSRLGALAASPGGSPSVMAPVAPVRVSCDQPHIDEVTRLVDLDPVFTRWPGASTVAQAAQDRCAGALRDFAGAIDAAPHHIVGTIYPSEPSWQDGARLVACTVRADDLRPRPGPFRVVGSIGT
jgi:hypothetical protein